MRKFDIPEPCNEEESTYYVCDYCNRPQTYAVVETEFSKYVKNKGNAKPVVLSGLEGKRFCSDVCAIKYVVNSMK